MPEVDTDRVHTSLQTTEDGLDRVLISFSLPHRRPLRLSPEEARQLAIQLVELVQKAEVRRRLQHAMRPQAVTEGPAADTPLHVFPGAHPAPKPSVG